MTDQSPDLPAHTSSPIRPTSIFSPSLVARVIARGCRIFTLTVVCFPPLIAFTLLGSVRAPKLLRWYLQASGGLFVKLGQLLALRYDLLPAHYCKELSTLLDALAPVSTPVITTAIEAALGKPVGDLFLQFDDRPLSCASVAQVHGATLQSGESVVVKIVRPGIEACFRADLLFVTLWAHCLEFLGFGSRIGLRRLARELATSTREEFDLIRELRNAEMLDANIRGDGVNHVVPKMYPALSCRSVLTMERIEGITVSKLIAAVENQEHNQPHVWSLKGIDPDAMAALLLRSMLVQMFRHRTFHADPHSANILVCSGGKLAFVDFGIFGWLDERQLSQQIKVRQALAADKIHAAYLALVADFTFPTGTDVAAFELEVKGILWNWSRSSLSRHASIQEKSAGQLFLQVFGAARHAGVGIPSGLMRFFRALIISDMVILKLNPRIDILGEVRKFLSEETALRTVKMTARGVASAPAAIARLAAESPEIALEVLEWLEAETRATRAPAQHAEGLLPGRLVRTLLNQGAFLSGVFTLLAIVKVFVLRIPGFDETMSAIGVDIGRSPGLTIGAGVVSFVFLRRLGTAFGK